MHHLIETEHFFSFLSFSHSLPISCSSWIMVSWAMSSKLPHALWQITTHTVYTQDIHLCAHVGVKKKRRRIKRKNTTWVENEKWVYASYVFLHKTNDKKKTRNHFCQYIFYLDAIQSSHLKISSCFWFTISWTGLL